MPFTGPGPFGQTIFHRGRYQRVGLAGHHPVLKGFGARGRVSLWLRQAMVNAAQVCGPDGYSLEFVYKSWQHEGRSTRFQRNALCMR